MLLASIRNLNSTRDISRIVDICNIFKNEKGFNCLDTEDVHWYYPKKDIIKI